MKGSNDATAGAVGVGREGIGVGIESHPVGSWGSGACPQLPRISITFVLNPKNILIY